MTGEIFSQPRFERCASIQHMIMDNWQKKRLFECTVRATSQVSGLTSDELRKQHFAIGVNQQLTEVPFHDMLVIFSMIKQEWAQLKEHEKRLNKSKEFSIQYSICTEFPDDEAVLFLSGIQIETSFDEGEFLRVSESLTDHR